MRRDRAASSPTVRGPGRPARGQAAHGRSALLRAARELMAERGLPRVTLREVASRAGVQPALVSYHFGSKAELLEAVIDEVAAEARSRIVFTTAKGARARDRLEGVIRGLIRGIGDDPYAPRLIVELVLFPEERLMERYVREIATPTAQALESLLEDGRRSGEFRALAAPFFIPSLLGLCVFFFLSAPVLRRVFELEPLSPDLVEKFADSAVDLVLHGTGPLPELAG